MNDQQIIPRAELIARLEAIGAASVLAISADGTRKLAGRPEAVKLHVLHQVWRQGYGVLIPALGAFSDTELFEMAHGRQA